jgi:hypothetical protein
LNPLKIGHEPLGNERDYANLQVQNFIFLVRGWALNVIRSLLEGSSANIELGPKDAAQVLKILDGAKPSERTAVRIAEMADRMGVLSDPFDHLSEIDRLVLDAGRHRHWLEKLLIRLFWGEPWSGFGPVAVKRFERLLIRAAFEHQPYLNEVHILLDSYLKKSVLLHAEQRLVPNSISPTLSWIVVALSLRPKVGGRKKGRANQAHQLMLSSALRLAREPGWAGFWEQWLLRELVKVGSVRDDYGLCNVVRTLPLIAQGVMALETPPNPIEEFDPEEGSFDTDIEFSGAMVVAERWIESAPTYAKRLLGDAI